MHFDHVAMVGASQHTNTSIQACLFIWTMVCMSPGHNIEVLLDGMSRYVTWDCFWLSLPGSDVLNEVCVGGRGEGRRERGRKVGVSA